MRKMADLYSLYGAVTLKSMSRSPKSNHLFPPSSQCIYVSSVQINQLVQKITHVNEAMQTRTPTRTPTGSAPKTICLPSIRLRGHTIVTLYVACPSIKHAISKDRITKALIRLRACACWTAPLCARIQQQRQVFSRRGYLSKNAVNNCYLIFEISR